MIKEAALANFKAIFQKLMEGPMKTTKISFMNAGKLGLEFLHVHA
jgi:hypothetical protein